MEHISKKASEHLTTMILVAACRLADLPVLRHSATATAMYLVDLVRHQY
jgi:hypothetical protein